MFGILLLCPLLVSCNTLHITYSTADWILLWKLDRYFALSASQENYLDLQVEAFHVWHRHHQLPQYAQFLGQIDEYSKNALSQEELEDIFSSVERFRVHLARRASPPGAAFLATVTPAQIRHFEEMLDQDYRRLVSEIGDDPEVRLDTRVATTSETLTTWVGELSVDQEIYIRERMRNIPDTTDVWLAHRKRRQEILLELLRSSRDPFSLEQGLFRWLADSKSGATEEYLMVSRKWREGVRRAVLDIDRILNQDQRAHFSRRLQGLIQDIHGLIG
ncbi:MAG: hypothetical protein NPIRA03_28890 [Nitrospirales bacterium]|nr:MAG: hypothetical protein NPIRA03_28890 [Nitrospirales bacterium]